MKSMSSKNFKDKIYFKSNIHLFRNRWKVLWMLSMLAAVVYGKYSPQGQRVCLVGAGVAGILSSNKLLQSNKKFDIIVFDKNSDVGGQWIYTDRTDVDEHGYPVTSNIYKYMR